MRSLQRLWLGLCLALCACGGGGGGGGASTSISVSPTSLSFTQQQGASPQARITTVHYKGDGVIVGYAPGVTPPSWVQVAQSGNATADTVDFNVTAGTPSLAAGSYSTSLRYVSGHADGTDIVYQDVPISLTVLPPFGLSNYSLQFDAVQGSAAPQSQTVQVFKNDANWSAVVDQSWVHAALQANSGGGSIAVSVDPSNLAPGSYTAHLSVSDRDGVDSAQTVTITLNLRGPQLQLGASQLNFSTVNGASTPLTARSVGVTSETATQVGFSLSVIYGPGAADWLQLGGGGSTPASLSVIPTTTNLPAGTYAANVVLTPSDGQPSVQFSVSYQVTAALLTATPGNVGYTVVATTSASELSRQISFQDNGTPIKWSVSGISVPWLTASPSSGNSRSAAQLVLSLDSATLADVKNTPDLAADMAQVNIRYQNANGSGGSLPIGASLSLNLPEVDFVGPVAGEAGTSLPVVMQGSGFSSMADKTVLFGSTAAPNAQVLADNVLRITAPNLAAGQYTLKIANKLGIARPAASYHAVTTPAYTATFLPDTGNTGRLIYDPLRNAVYVVNNAANPSPGVVRYSEAGGQWTSSMLVNGPVVDANLSSDGNSLWLSQNNALYSLDLTKAGAAPVFAIAGPASSNGAVLTGLTPLGDGNLLFSATPQDAIATVYLYSPAANNYDPLSTVQLSSPLFAVSVDASRAWLSNTYGGGYYAYLLDPVQGLLKSSQLTAASRAAMNRDGSLIALASQVYDSGFNTVAYYSGSSDVVPVFSPDGKRLFCYQLIPNSPDAQANMVVYDTSQAPVNQQYPVLATVPIGNRGGTTAATSTNAGTVFFLGYNGLLVVTAP